MPVMVFFRLQDRLTIAVINRRTIKQLNSPDADRQNAIVHEMRMSDAELEAQRRLAIRSELRTHNSQLANVKS